MGSLGLSPGQSKNFQVSTFGSGETADLLNTIRSEKTAGHVFTSSQRSGLRSTARALGRRGQFEVKVQFQ